MARRPKVDADSVFRKTEPTAQKAEPTTAYDNKSVTIPVSMKQSDKSLMADLADELGISQSSLCRYAILYVIQQHRRGKLDLKAAIKTRTVKELQMPD